MNIEINFIKEHYLAINNVLKLPKNEDEYQRIYHLMLELVDTVNDDVSHPLEPLLELLEILVERYEELNDSELLELGDLSSPSECLKYLMEAHNLKQKDITDIFGSQGHVSDILNEKRPITARQAKKLSKKFGVSPAVFI